MESPAKTVATILLVLVALSPFYLLHFMYRKSNSYVQGLQTGPRYLTLLCYVIVVGLLFEAVERTPGGWDRSKQSEARMCLGQMYALQMEYFGEHGTYASGTDSFNILHWRPEGNTLYSYFCGDDVIGALHQNALSAPPVSDWPDVIPRPASSSTGFTCLAAGNVDLDPYLDVWSMNNAKVLSNPCNDPAGETKLMGLPPRNMTLKERFNRWRMTIDAGVRYNSIFTPLSLAGCVVLFVMICRDEKRYRRGTGKSNYPLGKRRS